MAHVRAGILMGFGLALVSLFPVQADEKREVISPFNGTDLKGWKARDDKNNKWVVGFARMDDKEPQQLTVQVLRPGQEGGPRVHELVNDLKKGGARQRPLHRTEVR